MAFRLDMRLRERNLLMFRFSEYGINKKCLRCPLFNDCDTPQYNAPGIIRFFCRDYKEAKIEQQIKRG